jgi:DNA primase
MTEIEKRDGRVNEASVTHERERLQYGLRKAIEAVKDAVPIADYAGTLTQMRSTNGTFRGRCPIHGGDNPQSFVVYPGQGRWHCFRCNEGGDVVDLARAVEGGELWEAMMVLAERYNVELYQRPSRWHDWQNEKGRRRKSLRDILGESYRRRFFRAYYTEYLRSIEPEIREEEAERLWSDLYSLSFLCADQRLSS